MSKNICYGDVLYINLDNLVFYASGFYEPTLYLVENDNFNFKPFRNGLFKILPQLGYKELGQTEELKVQLDLLKTLYPDNVIGASALASDIQGETEIVKSGDEKIEALNEKTLNEMIGTPVLYGHKVQFLHIESNSFISVSPNMSKYDKKMIGIELSPESSTNSCFKLMPTMNFVHFGDPIEYDTEIHIKALHGFPLKKGVQVEKEYFAELNPERNTITRSGALFPLLNVSRQDPLFEFNEHYVVGIDNHTIDGCYSFSRYSAYADNQTAITERAFMNGDYLRIFNEKEFLTIYPYHQESDNKVFFQSYASEEYKKNKLWSLFQLIQKQEDQSNLPESNLLRDDPKSDKKLEYMLKHVASGRFIYYDGTKVTVQPAESKKFSTFQFLVQSLTQDEEASDYITKNNAFELILTTNNSPIYAGDAVDLPPAYDSNTIMHFGFKMTEDYLNKLVRPERYECKISNEKVETEKIMKFDFISEYEFQSINLLHSYSCQIQRYLDIINDVIISDKILVKDFNAETQKIVLILNDFKIKLVKFDENGYVIDKLKQELLREFRVFDLLIRVIYYLLLDDRINKRFEAIQAFSVKDSLDDLDSRLDFSELVKLFKNIEDLINYSYEKNDLNHFYTNQFVRVNIKSLLEGEKGIFSHASYAQKMVLRKTLLDLTKLGLWDLDLDSLGQLNFYQDEIFNGIKNQTTYHDVFLNLVNHIANSSAPNLDNRLRDNFIVSFLKADDNFLYTFPQLILEGNNILIEFRRRGVNETIQIRIEELNEKLINTETYQSFEQDKIAMLTHYFNTSLDLILSLDLKQSSTFSLLVIKHMHYEVLSLAADKLRGSDNNQIKVSLNDILVNIHQDYLDLPFYKFPNQIQVVNSDEMNIVLDDIRKYIQDIANNTVSEVELEHIHKSGCGQAFEKIKSLLGSGGRQDEIFDLMKTKISVKEVDRVTIIIDGTKKLLSSQQDQDFDFLKNAHQMLLSFIAEFLELKAKKEPIHDLQNILETTLEVFQLVKEKIVLYATQEISDKLKQITANKISANLGDQVDPAVAYLVSSSVEEWKTGSKLYVSNGQKNSTEVIANQMLEMFLLKNHNLSTNIINQLKKLTTIEISIYKELAKDMIISDVDLLKKITNIIKITTRLSQISREVNFCSENNVSISNERLQQIYSEISSYMWDILFSIYKPENHFAVVHEDPREEFKRLYIDSKKPEINLYFKIKPHAVANSFQKVLKILRTYRYLLKTVDWILKKDFMAPEPRMILHMIFDVISIFLYKNHENQNALSSSDLFIKLYYNQKAFEPSPGFLSMFSEMMRNNKKLSRLPTKYLYDITFASFVQTLNRGMTSASNAHAVSACLSSLHFLARSGIAAEEFNPHKKIKKLLDELSNLSSFESIRIDPTPLHVQVPLYYNVRELLESSVFIVENFPPDAKAVSKSYGWLNFKKWISFFQSRIYLAQFDLKNYAARIIKGVYYNDYTDKKLIQDLPQCKEMVMTLGYEIIYYCLIYGNISAKSASKFRDMIDYPNFINVDSTFDGLKKVYDEYSKFNFKDSKIKCFVDEIPLGKLYEDYIFDGCIDLLISVLLNEANHCMEIVDKRNKIKSLLDFGLMIVEELIENKAENKEIYAKFEIFLSKASIEKSYANSKERIIELTNKLYSKKPVENTSNQVVVRKKIDYGRFFTGLLTNKAKIKDEGITTISLYLSKHKKMKKILREMIAYLKATTGTENLDENLFLIKILTRVIQHQNSLAKNQAIYDWEEIKLNELLKIKSLQEYYRDLGLTKLIFHLLEINDENLFREVLLLSLAYFYGGNRRIQEDFYENFIKDEKNRIITSISSNLVKSWQRFEIRETYRIDTLYERVQRNMFDYLGSLNGKKMNNSDLEHFAMHDIDEKWTESAYENAHGRNLLIILSFIQGLCEKQFDKMQNFIRVQMNEGKKYPRSFDFLDFFRQMVNNYPRIMTKYNSDIGIKIVDVIVEAIQGEVPQNIETLLQKTFIYDVSRILTDYNSRYHTLPRGFGLSAYGPEITEFKVTIISCLKTIAERANENILEILKSHLDLQGITESVELHLLDLFERNKIKFFRTPKMILRRLSDREFQETFILAVDFYCIIRYLYQNEIEFKDRMRSIFEDLTKLKDAKRQDFLHQLFFKILPAFVSSVELKISTRADPLIKIWFPIIPSCHYFAEVTKIEFMEKVERTNSSTKITGLIETIDEFDLGMRIERAASTRLFGFNFRLLYFILRIVTNILAILITGINLGTFKSGPTQEESYVNAIQDMNLTQIAISAAFILLWLFTSSETHRSTLWGDYTVENSKVINRSPALDKKINEGDYGSLNAEECLLILKLDGPNSISFKELKKIPEKYKHVKHIYIMNNIKFSVYSYTLIWHIVYCGICIGSYYNTLASVFQIFDIAVRSDTIGQIAKAISKNGSQFLWTVFLLITTNIIYSIIGFFYYNSYFIVSDKAICNSAFECLFNTLDFGLRSGGGIADAIQPLLYNGSNFGEFLVRIIFDLTFFLIIIILMLNLIFGMIIDAFSDLRDEKANCEEDKANVCFICGINRNEYERYANFDEHTKEQHNPWSYVYFVIYLVEKYRYRKNELSDIENYVIEKYLGKDYEWLPIGSSLVLQNLNKAEENQDNQAEMQEILQKSKDEIMEDLKAIEVNTELIIDEAKDIRI